MNLEERAEQWKSAWRWVCPEDDYNDLAKDEPHPTLPYIKYARDTCTFSPLGFAVAYRPMMGKAVRTLLERGASPEEIARVRHKNGKIQELDAFQVACRFQSSKMLRLLLKYGTPIQHIPHCGSWVWVGVKRARTASSVSLGWIFTQLQRDDLIEPVVQRLASISLKKWEAPMKLVPKKIKLEK